MDFKNKVRTSKGYTGPEYKKREPGSGKPPSFEAVCAECSAACVVPFKPTGRKPVLCAKCFNKDGTAYAHKPWERGAERIAAKKPMFPAVCDRCSASCEVPFEPIAGRPIYCTTCLGHSDKFANATHDAVQCDAKLAALNAKLDALMAALEHKK